MRLGAAAALLCAFTLSAADAAHHVTTTVLALSEQNHPLTNLKEADFSVSERGISLPIFGLRRTGTSKGFVTNRPPDGYVTSNRPLAAFYFPQPVTVLLLDTADTDPLFQRWMQAQVLRFLTMMRPSENVAIYQLATSGLKLVHEFSNAPAAMGDEISTGGLARGTDRFILRDDHIWPIDNDTSTELEAQGGDTTKRAARYARTCTAVTKLAGYLGQFTGRKNLIWLSADFPPLGAADSKDPNLTGRTCPGMVYSLAAADVSVYPTDVRSTIAVEPFVKPLPGSVNLLPAKRRAALSPALASSMVTLSAVSGGKAIANSGQLAERMTDAVEASRGFYELTFEVPAADWNGKIHVIEVTSPLKQAHITAKRLYFAGRWNAPLDALFDSPAIGLSVVAASEAGTRLSLFVAARDLTWTQAGDKWRADLQFSIGDQMPFVKSFELTAEQHASLEQQTVSIEAETREHIAVRDIPSGRTGSLTIPVGRH